MSGGFGQPAKLSDSATIEVPLAAWSGCQRESAHDSWSTADVWGQNYVGGLIGGFFTGQWGRARIYRTIGPPAMRLETAEKMWEDSARRRLGTATMRHSRAIGPPGRLRAALLTADFCGEGE